MKYKNLEFFTKNGDSCNFEYDSTEELWTGSIYIPKISSGLFETEHLFIYEKVKKGEFEYYAKPHIYSYDTSNSISISWIDNTTPELLIYNINEDKFIDKLELIEVGLDYDTSDTIVDDVLNTDLVTKEYIQINIASNSDREGIFENYLLIKDNNDDHIIAKIYVYGEIEGEDLRLKTLCNNLGYFITEEDEKIFADSDIDEELINHILLNRKRKEILLEGSNIFPFVGAYKGLINAINFFGFNDLTVREYWRNVNIESKNYGKYKQSEILEIFNNDVNFNTELINTSNYRKTNDIALVYQMYDVYEDALDKYDLPTVQENFKYTVEEVLIKLYALKEKLKKTFLPYTINIKDIIAEGEYFTKQNKTYTTSYNKSIVLDKGINPTIELLTKNNEIIDLRNVYELITQYEFDSYFEHDIRNRLTETPEDWGEYIAALFMDYYPKVNSLENLPDKKNIPIGCPIVLKNTSFEQSIKSVDSMLKNLNKDNDYVIDFEIKTPLIGDTYILEETESGIKIEYNVTSVISEDVLTEEMLTLFDSQTQLPWVLFLSQIVEKESKKYLRIEARDVSTSNISFNFESRVINGLGTIEYDKFNKYFITVSKNFTMSNISSINYYEMEWRIYNDDLTFDYTAKGSIDQYEELAIVLTKQGYYHVDIKLYNTNNIISRKLFKNFLNIKMKASDFLGVYRRISDKYTDLKSLENIKFKDNKFVAVNPLIVQETQLKNCNVTFNALNRISLLPNKNYKDNFLYTVMNFKPNQDISFPGPFTFAAMGKNITVKDLRFIATKWTMLSGDTPASFDIKDINIGGLLTIKDTLSTEKGTHVFQTNDLKTAAIELTNSIDPIISKYLYSYIDNDEGYFPDSDMQSYIHVAGKYDGKHCDWENIEYENIHLDNLELSRVFGYKINDFEILDNFRAFEGAVYIQFSPDNNKIPGKTSYKWTIENISDEDFENVYFFEEYMGFLFHKKGNYRITLTIEDNHGNTNTMVKNIIKII